MLLEHSFLAILAKLVITWWAVRFCSAVSTVVSPIKSKFPFVCFVFYWPKCLIKVKSRGLEEIPVFDISEKTINGTEKPLSADEEGLASGIF